MVVRAPAELDVVTAPGFRDELAMLLSHGAHALVIDMSDTEFVDSSGMGALVGARKLAAARGGSLSMIGVAPKVAGSLRFAGLTEFLGVDVEHAD